MTKTFPDFVALDDSCAYATVKLFSLKERARKFGADFDKAGDIRTQRISHRFPPVPKYKGRSYYPVYGRHHVLTGDQEVHIPSTVKFLSLIEGRKAARTDTLAQMSRSTI